MTHFQHLIKYCLDHITHLDVKFLVSRNMLTQNLRVYYDGWNFNSGNYLFTTDTK